MKIALIQICSGIDPVINMAKISRYIDDCKSKYEIDTFFLPEVFYSMSDGSKPTPFLVREENEHYGTISKLAKDKNVYLIGGSVAYEDDGEILNRNLNFGPSGELLEFYDKKHLFAVNLRGNQKSTVIDESDVYSAGDELKLLDHKGFSIGLSICFDIRFPEMFREFYKRGVNLISVSAAFTVPTGRAHWETLLRARAIENQSYVVATGQWGEHNEKISTFGHSMVIDPWGRVISKIEEGEGYITAELSLSEVEKIRGRMNVSPRD